MRSTTTGLALGRFAWCTGVNGVAIGDPRLESATKRVHVAVSDLHQTFACTDRDHVIPIGVVDHDRSCIAEQAFVILLDHGEGQADRSGDVAFRVFRWSSWVDPDVHVVTNGTKGTRWLAQEIHCLVGRDPLQIPVTGLLCTAGGQGQQNERNEKVGDSHVLISRQDFIEEQLEHTRNMETIRALVGIVAYPMNRSDHPPTFSGRSRDFVAALPEARFRLLWVLAGLLTLVGSQPLLEAQSPHELDGEDLVRTRVFASVGAVKPGARFEIAIRFEMTKQWHIYWRNAGGSGMPTELDITVPEGFVVGSTLWPTPKVFPGSEPSYGYDDEVVLLVPVNAPASLVASTVEITVDLSWLVCKKSCLFGAREHQLELPVSDTPQTAKIDASDSELIATWQKRMPIPAKSIPGLKLRVDGDRFIIEGPLADARAVWFYPEDTRGVMPAAPGPVRGRLANGRFHFDIPLEIEPGNALGGVLKVAGIIVPVPGESGALKRPIAIELPLFTSESTSTGVTTPETLTPARGS
jgi:DsbC/DsbD-like thiol-disulfide interchange protein